MIVILVIGILVDTMVFGKIDGSAAPAGPRG